MHEENKSNISPYVELVKPAFQSDTSDRTYWVGPTISALRHNEIFVFGANPGFVNGAGGAAAAMRFGAYYGSGRGIVGKTYGIVTKNLEPRFYEESTEITYPNAGSKSVTAEQIRANIAELYTVARRYPNLQFLITFKLEVDVFGKDKPSLNGYPSKEMAALFLNEHAFGIPDNIIFHHSYAELIQDWGIEKACVPVPNAPPTYVVKDDKRFDLDYHAAVSRQNRVRAKAPMPDNQSRLF